MVFDAREGKINGACAHTDGELYRFDGLVLEVADGRTRAYVPLAMTSHGHVGQAGALLEDEAVSPKSALV